jgi:hypothetical protein
VFWRSLFKDSSFQKQVMSAGGARVRIKARMQERAIDKAEAKLGEELRATKRQLQNKEKESQEIEKQAEERLKVQEMEARKAEKDLTKGHKRQLALIRGDLERTREEETRTQEELVRGVRQKQRQIAKELEATQQHLKDKTETNEALDKAVRKGVEKLEGLREDGLCWKRKYVAEKSEVRLMGDKLVEATLERRKRLREGESVAKRSGDLVAELREKLAAAEVQAKVSVVCLLSLSSFVSFVLCPATGRWKLSS